MFKIEFSGVCRTLFRPVSFFMAFHDGVHDPMHEWEFRGGLDHWAAFIGKTLLVSWIKLS